MGDERPLGTRVEWHGARVPAKEPLEGRTVVLRPLEVDRDVEALFRESHEPHGDPAIWDYLFEGPFDDVEQMRALLAQAASGEDPMFFTIEPRELRVAAGQCTYMRVDAPMGSIEIGNIWFGPRLQRTTAATEAIYLLARHAFRDLGYRRLEWKCNALNAPSRRAAERFGFTFEGTFRRHIVVKGRNRDTAWYSIIDSEWPRIEAGFEAFLDPANFDAEGRQRRSLADFLAG